MGSTASITYTLCKNPGNAASSLEKANWYFEQGNYVQAEEFLLVALEEAKVRYGEENVETLALQNHLCVIYCKQGQLEEAKSLLEHVSERYNHLLGSKHPVSLQAQHNLGLVLFQSRRYGEAAKVFESCYHGRLAMLGGSHVDTLSSVQQLTMCFLEECRYAEAEEVLRVCLSNQHFLLSPEHHLVIALTVLQSSASEGLEKSKKAVELYDSALKRCSCSVSSEGSGPADQRPASCLGSSFCKMTADADDDFDSSDCGAPMASKGDTKVIGNSNSTVDLIASQRSCDCFE
eukprot:gene5430-5975_t